MYLLNIRKHCSEYLPKTQDFSEKDIIYLLRNLSSKNYNDSLLEIFQKELIEFLKEKKSNNSFNFNKTDIDENIILTYPCVNNLYLLVDYLITDIYDTKKFSTIISNAIFPSVWPLNKKTFDLIFNNHIHQDYKDITIQNIYKLSNRVQEATYKEHYYLSVEKILKNSSFELILASLLLESDDLSNELNHFLTSSTISNDKKILSIDNNLANFGKCFFRKNANHTFIEKFKLQLELNMTEINQSTSKSIKNKL